MVYDCIIIGAGPAGLTAALYLLRFYRNILLIHNNKSRATLIPNSNNYPGYSQGISGKKILMNLQKQILLYPFTIIEDSVLQLTFRTSSSTFYVRSAKHKFNSKKVILATGLLDIKPDSNQLKPAIKKRLVKFCPVCDGYEVSNKKIGIFCNDKKGIEEALFLNTYTQDITLLTQTNFIKLTHKEKQKLDEKNIKILKGSMDAIKIIRKDKIAVVIQSKHYAFDALYSALGVKVLSDLAINLGARFTRERYLIVNDRQETNIKGLYAIGDVSKGLNQISVGMGQAAIASTNIHKILNKSK